MYLNSILFLLVVDRYPNFGIGRYRYRYSLVSADTDTGTDTDTNLKIALKSRSLCLQHKVFTTYLKILSILTWNLLKSRSFRYFSTNFFTTNSVQKQSESQKSGFFGVSVSATDTTQYRPIPIPCGIGRYRYRYLGIGQPLHKSNATNYYIRHTVVNSKIDSKKITNN